MCNLAVMSGQRPKEDPLLWERCSGQALTRPIFFEPTDVYVHTTLVQARATWTCCQDLNSLDPRQRLCPGARGSCEFFVRWCLILSYATSLSQHLFERLSRIHMCKYCIYAFIYIHTYTHRHQINDSQVERHFLFIYVGVLGVLKDSQNQSMITYLLLYGWGSLRCLVSFVTFRQLWDCFRMFPMTSRSTWAFHFRLSLGLLCSFG